MKAYQALYNNYNTRESEYTPLSTHFSREGAEKVIEDHKKKVCKEWEGIEIMSTREDGLKVPYYIEWQVKEIEILP